MAAVPHSFLQQYDVLLNLHGPDGTTYSKWEGITNLSLQMQGIDETIKLLPWAVMDQQHQLPITITCIPQVFFDFQMYIPGLASMQVSLRSQLELGNMRHPSLLLQSSVPPTQLADQLRPWMEATKQCMWVCQLPLVEQTRCIGWLLYLALEYNLDNLHWQIKKDMGILWSYASKASRTMEPVGPTGPYHKAKQFTWKLTTAPVQCLEMVYSARA